MHYTLNKIAWFLLDPANLLAALLIIGVLALFLGGPLVRKFGRGLLALLALAVLVITLLPPQFWYQTLESRFQIPDPLPDRVDGIVVMGGGLSTTISDHRGRPELNGSADRLTTMIALASRYPEAKVIYASGGRSDLDETVREADFIPAVLEDLGIPPDRIILERDSRNTYENAIEAKKVGQPQDGETWILLTSAFHMPRSVGVFRKQGWPVVPYPVDYHSIGGTLQLTSPSFFEGLKALRLVAKEWLGLIGYRHWGWLSTLWPGPEEIGKQVNQKSNSWIAWQT